MISYRQWNLNEAKINSNVILFIFSEIKKIQSLLNQLKPLLNIKEADDYLNKFQNSLIYFHENFQYYVPQSKKLHIWIGVERYLRMPVVLREQLEISDIAEIEKAEDYFWDDEWIESVLNIYETANKFINLLEAKKKFSNQEQAKKIIDQVNSSLEEILRIFAGEEVVNQYKSMKPGRDQDDFYAQEIFKRLSPAKRELISRYFASIVAYHELSKTNNNLFIDYIQSFLSPEMKQNLIEINRGAPISGNDVSRIFNAISNNFKANFTKIVSKDGRIANELNHLLAGDLGKKIDAMLVNLRTIYPEFVLRQGADRKTDTLKTKLMGLPGKQMIPAGDYTELLEFMKSLSGDTSTQGPEQSTPDDEQPENPNNQETTIVPCPKCGARLEVNNQDMDKDNKCGNCGNIFKPNDVVNQQQPSNPTNQQQNTNTPPNPNPQQEVPPESPKSEDDPDPEENSTLNYYRNAVDTAKNKLLEPASDAKTEKNRKYLLSRNKFADDESNFDPNNSSHFDQNDTNKDIDKLISGLADGRSNNPLLWKSVLRGASPKGARNRIEGLLYFAATGVNNSKTGKFEGNPWKLLSGLQEYVKLNPDISEAMHVPEVAQDITKKLTSDWNWQNKEVRNLVADLNKGEKLPAYLPQQERGFWDKNVLNRKNKQTPETREKWNTLKTLAINTPNQYLGNIIQLLKNNINDEKNAFNVGNSILNFAKENSL